MKTTFLRRWIASLLGTTAHSLPGATFVGRARTLDVAVSTAIPYRMRAGFPGDVNRTHPFSVEPAVNDPDDPVLGYGRAVVVVTANNSVRNMKAGDGALTKIYGVSVRPYPIQQSSGGMDAAFGTGTPPQNQPVDVLRSGYIMVPVVGSPTKGGAVYVWIAADSGDHVQGGFEAAADGGNTILLASDTGSITFNGPPDSEGVTELIFNV